MRFACLPGRALAGIALLLPAALAGCGTTRSTDTTRAASEMLLVSQAVDEAVAKIDFSPLSNQPVFLDVSAVEKDIVDRGYVVSVIRQQLLAAGALLQEERFRAVYIVEIRSGAVGTDRHSLLFGTPAVSLPSIVPGVPGASIPEIALMKKNDQRGVAKLGVFAYNRISGRALWQSGTVEAESHARDTWVFGAGPFSRGSIRRRTELAGEPLPTFPLTLFDHPDAEPTRNAPSREQYFSTSENLQPPPPIPAAALGVMGVPALADRQTVR
jgi:hypothetical protein